MTAGDVGDHLRDEERIVTRARFLVHGIIAGLEFKGVKTADTCCHDNADTVFIDILAVESGVGHCLTGCDYAILGVEVELTGFFAVEVLVGIKVFNLAGELCLKLRGVEVGYGSGTATTGLRGLPCRGNVVAQRRDCAQAGDNYTFKFHFCVVCFKLRRKER